MASLTIRDLDDESKERLRVRAARRGRSMEAEARSILREAVSRSDPTPVDLADAISARFHAFGGVDLDIPERGPIRKPPAPRL